MDDNYFLFSTPSGGGGGGLYVCKSEKRKENRLSFPFVDGSHLLVNLAWRFLLANTNHDWFSQYLPSGGKKKFTYRAV